MHHFKVLVVIILSGRGNKIVENPVVKYPGIKMSNVC